MLPEKNKKAVLGEHVNDELADAGPSDVVLGVFEESTNVLFLLNTTDVY
jgi:hypothetical protein